MRAGIDVRKITPQLGVDLAGFGRKGRKAWGLHDDLFLSALVMEQNGQKFVLICADILGFGIELADQIKKEIREKFNINEDRVLLCASHTHSGPQTSDNMLAVGIPDAKYNEFLRETILTSVKAAADSIEEMEIFYGKTECNIGINRRHIVNGKAEFEPSEEAPLDKEVVVVKLVKDKKIKAVLYNYACHPSTVDTDDVSADYPGSTRDIIKERLGKDTAVFFLQGCCGNIRVRSIDGDKFRAGTWHDVESFGTQLGNNITEICQGEMKKLDENISAKLVNIMLPLEKIPDKEQLNEIIINGNVHQQEWARKMLQNYDKLRAEVPFTIQWLSLGSMFEIIAMSGEVCVEYGLYIKNNSNGKTIMPVAYSNGVVGYIPTQEMFDQGGYEPDRSTIYYCMPSKFDRSIEDRILKFLI